MNRLHMPQGYIVYIRRGCGCRVVIRAELRTGRVRSQIPPKGFSLIAQRLRYSATLGTWCEMIQPPQPRKGLWLIGQWLRYSATLGTWCEMIQPPQPRRGSV